MQRHGLGAPTLLPCGDCPASPSRQRHHRDAATHPPHAREHCAPGLRGCQGSHGDLSLLPPELADRPHAVHVIKPLDVLRLTWAQVAFAGGFTRLEPGPPRNNGPEALGREDSVRAARSVAMGPTPEAPRTRAMRSSPRPISVTRVPSSHRAAHEGKPQARQPDRLGCPSDISEGSARSAAASRSRG